MTVSPFVGRAVGAAVSPDVPTHQRWEAMGTAPVVVGLDSCPGGWACVAWDGTTVTPFLARSLRDAVEEVRARIGAVDLLAVDIPIGLPDDSSRKADTLARGQLGPRASSVFPTPVRAAVQAVTYDEARRVSIERLGKSLSKQAYSLRTKILEVDGFVRDATTRVVEVHPEVSFAAMNDGPLPTSKKSPGGVITRLRLLDSYGMVLPQSLGELGERARIDDILDATAAAWTGLRVSQGLARCLPDPPERFSDDWPAAIWV